MIFELASTGYEDYCPYLFEHNSKTEKQFYRDVKFMLNKYCDDFLKLGKYSISAGELIEFIVPKMGELGYKQIKPYKVSIFGCCICQTTKHEDLSKILNKKLFKKILTHNEKRKLEQKKETIKFMKTKEAGLWDTFSLNKCRKGK